MVLFPTKPPLGGREAIPKEDISVDCCTREDEKAEFGGRDMLQPSETCMPLARPQCVSPMRHSKKTTLKNKPPRKPHLLCKVEKT